jgi:hypothetical protein
MKKRTKAKPTEEAVLAYEAAIRNMILSYALVAVALLVAVVIAKLKGGL